LAVSPRRISREGNTVNYEAASAVQVAQADAPSAKSQSNAPKTALFHTITSIVVIFASIGFLTYLLATRNAGTTKHIERKTRRTTDPVLLVTPPERKPKPLHTATESHFANHKNHEPVQLASALVQEPGQSDPNKPPPIAPSKKPPSTAPTVKPPIPNPNVPPPAAMPTTNPKGTENSKPTDIPKDPERQEPSGGPKSSPSTPQASSQTNPSPPPTPPTSPPVASGAGKDAAAGSASTSGRASDSTSKPATPPPPSTPAPAGGNGNSTIKELGTFLQGKLRPIFEGGIFASYSLEALRTENTGATSIRFTDDLSESSRERVVDSNFGIGQRAVLGIRGSMVGYRASYSSFLEETSRFDRPDFRSLWPDLSSMTRIDMHIADIELTQKHSINEVCIESFFGVRYAEYRGADMAVGVGKFATNLEAHAIAHSFRETVGIGPTFGMSAKKYLPWKFGCGMFESCETDCGNMGWSWFWSLRGSVLRSRVLSSAYTESQLGVYSSDTGVQGIARSADKSYLDQSRELNLFNGEFQLGLEYSRPLIFIPATASVRTSLVCQYWDTGPGVSTSQSFASLAGNSPDFSGRVDALAISDNRYLNLFGVNLTLGLNY
jgi:hypothetical protein